MIEFKVSIASEDVLRRINRASDELQSKVTDALKSSVLKIQTCAKKHIQQDQATGTVYRMRRKRRPHTASTIGQYPSTDTGRLANSIAINSRNLEAEVGTKVKYGAYLEFKAPEKGGRPWLVRSYEETKPEIEKLIDETLQTLFK